MRPGGTSEQRRIEAEVTEVRLSEHIVWKLKIRDEDWVCVYLIRMLVELESSGLGSRFVRQASG